MKAKIVFDFDYNPVDRSGFDLAFLPYNCEVPLTKNFNPDEVLAKIILRNETNFVFAEIDTKEEWYDWYPILGYRKGWSNSGETEFEFTGCCALTDKGVNPNFRIKNIREQLKYQGLINY